MSTQSCDHTFTSELVFTDIGGNNYDIHASWDLKRCKQCGLTEKVFIDSVQIPHTEVVR